MFFQIVGKGFAHSLIHSTHYLVVTELRLGLSFKLRLCHLDGDYRSQSFAEVIAGNFDFGFLQHLVVFGIFLQRTGQCTAETGKVRTAFDGIDIVYVRVNVLIIRRVVHDGHFHRCALLLGVDVYYIVHEVLA